MDLQIPCCWLNMKISQLSFIAAENLSESQSVFIIKMTKSVFFFLSFYPHLGGQTLGSNWITECTALQLTWVTWVQLHHLCLFWGVRNINKAYLMLWRRDDWVAHRHKQADWGISSRPSSTWHHTGLKEKFKATIIIIPILQRRSTFPTVLLRNCS